MRPSTMILTALYIFDCIGVAEFSGTEEVVVGFVEGDGGDGSGVIRVGGAEMGSHADDEERAGVVLACSYSGVVSYRVSVAVKKCGEFDGFRDVGTAGTC